MSLKLVDYPTSDEDSSDCGGEKSGEKSGGGKTKRRHCSEDEDENAENSGYKRRYNGKAEYDDAGHVQGGWSGHIYLKIDECAQLDSLATMCMDSICAHPNNPKANASNDEDGEASETADLAIDCDHIKRIAEPHISLSRPFYLQKHQIVGFVKDLETSILGCESFAVGFGRVSTYVNEQGDRGFVSADVDSGAERIKAVLDRVNLVMGRLGKRQFFDKPRFHASLLSVDLVQISGKDSAQACNKAIDAVGKTLGADIQEKVLRLAATRIDTLECIFGDKKFSVVLN
ncbi:poly(U)-specific 3'-to-5' RNA exonuclease [Kickxella alabastrina]|uniref:Poly(U)-specific 3'-to-5' RNA exonuclease n=1 Tax=Kickxella alabastrina TaxID=61397 RepID=A0ACC1IX74_9FUNG|nr:poly(U)-specific 3'-to-5' RNA exonuclease [Kickxella alabastrina]